MTCAELCDEVDYANGEIERLRGALQEANVERLSLREEMGKMNEEVSYVWHNGVC